MPTRARLWMHLLAALVLAVTAVDSGAAAMTVGVHRTSQARFYLDGTGDRVSDLTFSYGAPGDRALTGDFNGDGVSDVAIYRNGMWYIDENFNGSQEFAVGFGGLPQDVPVVADFNGDGRADLAIFRDGTWFVSNGATSVATSIYHFGTTGDVPVAADFNGDGVVDLAVFRNGTWYIDTNRDGIADEIVIFGGAGDLPIAFDYDGDGKADLGIFRAGIWYIATNRTPPAQPSAVFRFGDPGDRPLAVAMGPYSYRTAARMLGRTTFGSTRAEIVRAATMGTDAWLAEQFAKPATSFKDYVQPMLLAGQEQWALNSAMIWRQFFEGQDQLRLRVVFALSQIVVVSLENDTVQDAYCGPASYLDMLGANAFGNYADILKSVALHPIMGEYLNMKGSAKADAVSGQIPNENFAREMLQLFSIGTVMLNIDGTPQKDGSGKTIPTYDQNAVQAFARAYSGWTFANQNQTQSWRWLYPDIWAEDHLMRVQLACPAWSTPMQPWTTAYRSADNTRDIAGGAHDATAKQLLAYPGVVNGSLAANQTPMQDMDGAIANIFNHPNVGPFIGKQLIQRLVTSNPSPSYVGRVAQAFNNNGAGVRGDMKAVIRAVLNDPEATSVSSTLQPKWGKLREPVVRFVQAHRAFGGAVNNTSKYYSVWDLSDSSALAQDALRAPSVFNFFSPHYAPSAAFGADGSSAPEFQVTTTDSVAGYADFSKWGIIGGFRSWDASANPSYWIKPDYSYYTGIADKPAQMVNELDLVLTEGMLAPSLKDAITASISKIKINTANDRTERFKTALWLFLNTPDGLIQK